MGGDAHFAERRGVVMLRRLLMVGMSAVVMVTGVMCERTNDGSKVLLILVDGCRWDYPDQDPDLTGFRRIAENGVRSPHVTPIFPSNSYPNWYTIVTGLYAENHGFVQNIMYDPEKGEFFLMAPNLAASVPYWWEEAEPLWVTAEKAGLRSALYWWDGCQVEIRGKKPTFCRKYKYVGYSWTSVDSDTREAFLTALDLFENDEIQLVQVYYEPVDFYGHKYGPDSEERKSAMRKIDNLLDSLQKEIAARELEDQVNIVVVSDHGMKSPRNLNIINLQYEAVDVNDIRYMIYYGAASMILPFEGKLDKLYNSLIRIPGLKVYRKEEIPEKYHLRNNRLILPLLLVADKDSYIQGLDIPGKSIPTGSSIPFGSHGYDPYEVPEMRGIFFARGPAFKEGYITSPIEIVDIYNILCYLLDIEPHPNNGSWIRVHSMFKGAPEPSRSHHSRHLETLLSLLSLSVSIGYRFTCT